MDAVKTPRAPEIRKARARQVGHGIRDEMESKYLKDGTHRAAILDLCMDMALGLGADAFIRQSAALRDRPDQLDTLRGVTVRTLILCGRHDALCPVARHELMRELIADAALEIIEDAGHLPTLEQPQKTTAALIRWMEE